MAYGQTGSGKTHTMLGSYDNASAKLGNIEDGGGGGGEGVVPRAIREIFRVVGSRRPGIHRVEISVIEIYNNEIRDLLSSDSKMKHEVVTATDGSMCLPTVTSRAVKTEFEAMELMNRGLSERRQSATHVHEHSSRSHLLVIVTVTTKVTDLTDHRPVEGDQWANNAKAKSGPANKKQRSQIPRFSSRSLSSGAADVDKRKSGCEIYVKNKLQLIDLAGSECVGVSGVTGKHLREAVHINRSLCALADVLTALSEERSHVPYCNSRLTHLLQDTIGGDAKLLIILCVSPTRGMLTESIQSLQFGQRARQVQRGPIRKRSVSAPNSFALTATAASARDDAQSLSLRPVRSRSASLRAVTSEMHVCDVAPFL